MMLFIKENHIKIAIIYILVIKKSYINNIIGFDCSSELLIEDRQLHRSSLIN